VLIQFSYQNRVDFFGASQNRKALSKYLVWIKKPENSIQWKVQLSQVWICDLY